MKINNNDWFYLEPYVLCEVKGESLVLINTYDEKYFIFKLLGLLNNFILELLNNNYCIKLKKEYLFDSSVLKFIVKSRENYLSDIIEHSDILIKPFIPYPIANYQKDEGRVIGLNPIHGEDVISKLKELTLYVNSECNKNCKLCNSYYKQTSFCTKSFNKELPFNKIQGLFSQFSEYNRIGQVNISGADIFKYEHLSDVCNILKSKDLHINLQHYYLNIDVENVSNMEILKKADNIDILINLPLNSEHLQNVCLTLDKNNITYSFIIVVENEKQFLKIDEYLSENSVENYEIIPIYNGRNLGFFKKHVFIHFNDLRSLKISKNRYFLNKFFNTNNYGKITLTSDGCFYANVNHKTLGHIDSASIHEILYTELYHGESWNLIRNSSPCDKCVYQFICPPISNYEQIIGKNNLCHISE